MEKTKMTKKDYFELLKGFVAGDAKETELVEFLDKQIALATKKRATGMTKTQKENEVLIGKMLEVLAGFDKAVTISDIQGANDEMGALSNQKISALLKKVVDNGTVVKTMDKKKAYFAVATDVEVEDSEDAE